MCGSDSKMAYMKIILMFILFADEYGKCCVGVFFYRGFFSYLGVTQFG